jgi:hypothetical protein
MPAASALEAGVPRAHDAAFAALMKAAPSSPRLHRGAEVMLDRPFGRCACGSSDLDWISGEELRVREMEVV